MVQQIGQWIKDVRHGNPLIEDTPQRWFRLEMEMLLCRKKKQLYSGRNDEYGTEIMTFFLPWVEKSQVKRNAVDLNANQTFNGFFHIIFLWGLCLLFCLLADLIPFLLKHVGGAASNQLTNTDHRQAGGKSFPAPLCSSFSEAALDKHQVWLITWQSTRPSTNSIIDSLSRKDVSSAVKRCCFLNTLLTKQN